MPYKVTFTQSGKTVDCPEGRTVLEAGQDAGLDLPFSCQGGTCMTCRVKVQGPMDQEEALALSAEDRARGYGLICVGKPLGDLVVAREAIDSSLWAPFGEEVAFRGVLYPALFGALVAASSWRIGFVTVALFPLAGWRVLQALTR